MTTITKERIELFIKNPLENGLTRGEQMDLARIVLASLDAEPVLYAAEETLAYAKMGELHLTCLSEPMGDAVTPLCTAPPAPVVPDEWTIQDAVKFCRETGRQDAGSAMEAWNACRAAMLQGVEQPQNARQNIPENIPDGNSPAIPDDWVMVPKEPTQAMIKAWLSEVANFRGHAAGYKAALAAAPQREVK
ncbi:TPA: hypothetical protein ACIAWW_001850 [Salmonella enterica subsp. enterica serovar Saintpaul]|nr:hypothetical protein [Salmonella enterica subsp. enterica serovar Gaminara]EEI0286043.1 hypothetical protein [Salmonella enterica subsp. enterica serovar Hvittingfoss]EIF3593485.1 hypothetical protein [Salmonella enterica]